MIRKSIFFIIAIILTIQSAFCGNDLDGGCIGDYHYYCDGRKVRTIYCDDYRGDPSVKEECGDYFYDEDGGKCTYTGWNCRSTGYSNSETYCDAEYSCERPPEPTYTLTRKCGSADGKTATGTISNKTGIKKGDKYNLRDSDNKCSLSGYKLSGWSCTNGLTSETEWTIQNNSTCTAQWKQKVTIKLSKSELLYGRDDKYKNASVSEQCWTKTNDVEYKNCILGIK